MSMPMGASIGGHSGPRYARGIGRSDAVLFARVTEQQLDRGHVRGYSTLDLPVKALEGHGGAGASPPCVRRQRSRRARKTVADRGAARVGRPSAPLHRAGTRDGIESKDGGAARVGRPSAPAGAAAAPARRWQRQVPLHGGHSFRPWRGGHGLYPRGFTQFK